MPLDIPYHYTTSTYRLSSDSDLDSTTMATNSGRGNPIASADNPPTPESHPPPLPAGLKDDVQVAADGTGERAAGHEGSSSSLPATSVATGEQAEKVIRTAAEMGGK